MSTTVIHNPSRVQDPCKDDVVAAAEHAAKLLKARECKRNERVRFYDGVRVTGTAVYLNGWTFPIVVQPDGTVRADNYEGRWGSQAELDRFEAVYGDALTQAHTCRQLLQAAKNHGHKVTHDCVRPDGTREIRVSVGGESAHSMDVNMGDPRLMM